MVNRRIPIMTLTLGVILVIGNGGTDAQAAVEKSLDRGVEVIAQEIAETLPQDKKPLLAVLDFNDPHDCVSVLGRLTADKLVTKLFKTKRVQVVERGLLKKALAELKFNLSELVDPSRAKQLGKQVGADAIVSGTITDSVSSVEIIARAITVETGSVLATAEVEIAKDESVKQLVNQPVSCPEKGPRPKPTPTPPVEVTLPKFENQGVRVTVKSLRKEGNVLKVDLVYRNLLDVGKPDIKLIANSGNRYVADDAGEQWTLQQDSMFAKGAEYLALPPQVNIRVPLTFTAVGETSGKIFNLVMDHNCGSNCDPVGYQVRVLIRNITAE